MGVLLYYVIQAILCTERRKKNKQRNIVNRLNSLCYILFTVIHYSVHDKKPRKFMNTCVLFIVTWSVFDNTCNMIMKTIYTLHFNVKAHHNQSVVYHHLSKNARVYTNFEHKKKKKKNPQIHHCKKRLKISKG